MSTEFLFSLIFPLGVATLVLLLTTVALALSMRKFKGMFKWHKRCAILTTISALLHAGVIFFLH